MKIQPEHYQILKEKLDACANSLDSTGESITLEQLAREYRRLQMSPKRFRWDVLWISGLRASQQHNGGEWPVYDYLDDDHIDTALRHYFRERNMDWACA